MDGTLGKKYLETYIQKTTPLLEDYFLKKMKETKRIGEIPVDMLARLRLFTLKGKKIRGALMILGYMMCGKKPSDSVYAASICPELLHAGLLVQDDIMDRDEIRRGEPTIHTQYERTDHAKYSPDGAAHFGESMAILASDLAFFMAYETLVNSSFADTDIRMAIEVLSRHGQLVTFGQSLDITNGIRHDTTLTDIMTMYQYKTAQYTGVLPLILGATLAGITDTTTLRNLQTYGLCLGWIFQLQDDLLGIFGDGNDLGKTIGNDLTEKKNTVLMAHFMKSSTVSQRHEMEKIQNRNKINQSDLQIARDLFRASGSYDYCLNRKKRYIEQGENALRKIKGNKKILTILHSLLYFAAERIQ